jgi:hypothetical protein
MTCLRDFTGSPRGLPNRLNTSYQTTYSLGDASQPTRVKADVPQETRYKLGMQVRHKTYGVVWSKPPAGCWR